MVDNFGLENGNNIVRISLGDGGTLGKDFNNRKTCDNINSGASSEPVITDSLSQPLGRLRYLDNLSNNQCQQNAVIWVQT